MQAKGAAIALGAACVALGLFIVLLAAGVIPSEEKSFHAPQWVVGAAGPVSGRESEWTGRIAFGIGTSSAGDAEPVPLLRETPGTSAAARRAPPVRAARTEAPPA